MKPIALVTAILLMLLCLFGCSSSTKEESYTVVRDQQTFTVDPQGKTISFDGQTYHYQLEGSPESWQAELTYPDGETYWWNHEATSHSFSSGHGGWSEGFDPTGYADPDALIEILEEQMEARPSPVNWPVVIFLVIIGLPHIIWPERCWYLRHGWMYRSVEPSEEALAVSRLSGMIAVVVAVVMLLWR